MSEGRSDDEVRDRGWDRGFDGHARAQQERLARLPLWVRIEWLEEMQRFLAGLRPLPPETPRDDELPPNP